jgi:hypothetical protein
MNNRILASFMVAVAIVPAANAQQGTLRFGEPQPAPQPQPVPPRVWVDPEYRNPFATNTPPLTSPEVYVYDQKPIAGIPSLVTAEQAQTIIDRFKAAYPGLGSPRFLIYVNRELIDEQSGMKLIRRQERIESARSSGTDAGTTVRSTSDNTYRSDGKPEQTLADRQTVRDVERLFGRPLRAAGASLADQRVATQLIADRPLDEFIGTTDTPQARRDREALAKVADAVIEILISSKTITVPMVSGDRQVAVPDIQATAISLKDSKILGQASSTDVTARVPPATQANFSVHEVAEATALALLEDMTPAP